MNDATAIMMGPVLYFRGMSAARCQLAAIVVTPMGQTPPALMAEGMEVAPEILTSRVDKTLWRYTFSISAMAGEQGVTYSIGERAWRVTPPGGGPPRIAYTACNGYEENDCFGEIDPERNERWRHLAEEHARSPFQLLIQGGDQVYADDVWRDVPELVQWQKLSWRARLATPVSAAEREAVADYYFDRYCRLWGQRDLAPILASIPSLMMWDDHDIFDGWGSHSPAKQRCPMFQRVWSAAREQFALFQLASLPNDPPEGFGDPEGGHFGWVYDLGDMGIIAPDLRSRRTRRQVMGDEGWRWLVTALEGLGHCRHVLFVSTVPVLNINLSLLERMFAFLPQGRHFYQDDLRDQWRSHAHRQEWRRLVSHLLEFSLRTDTRVTILSGEIHLGALGVVEHSGTRIFQLTSSGIVHHPPPRLVAWIFDLLGRKSSTVTPGVRMRMLPLPGLGGRYLAARNWLSLESLEDGALRAEWHREGDLSEMEMVIT